MGCAARDNVCLFLELVFGSCDIRIAKKMKTQLCAVLFAFRLIFYILKISIILRNHTERDLHLNRHRIVFL